MVFRVHTGLGWNHSRLERGIQRGRQVRLGRGNHRGSKESSKPSMKKKLLTSEKVKVNRFLKKWRTEFSDKLKAEIRAWAKNL